MSSSSDPEALTSTAHIPVLCQPLVSLLFADTGKKWFFDGTLGAGGHSQALLRASAPDGRVIACDRDPTALQWARSRLADQGGRVVLLRGSFSQLAQHLAQAGVPAVDGMVLDLGFSSMQIDDPARGFSFSRSGPLDMRMDPDGEVSARELIAKATEPELVAILRDYGDERYSKRIAARMKQEVAAGRLRTTTELADVVAQCIPSSAQRGQRIHPATRTFQALRIAVNQELDQLARFLAEFSDYLNPNGRCAIISFHSLEDRMVKNAFRNLAWSSRLPRDLAAKAGERVEPICTLVTRKPITPSLDEVAANPRARSAKLRVCQRVAS